MFLSCFRIAQKSTEGPNVELQIVEPIDIARVAENIDEMTKKSKDSLEERASETIEKTAESNSSEAQPLGETTVKDESTEHVVHMDKPSTQEHCTEEASEEREKAESKGSTTEDQGTSNETESDEPAKQDEENVEIEYRRSSQENVEIIKDVDQVNSSSDLEEVCLRRKNSSGTLSRSDSFSVKDEIEKIEKQIKALETRNASRESSEEKSTENLHESTRQSIQANRRHFFQNMVENENDRGAVRIEFKELPREQTDIHVVRLNEPPVPVVAPREPVKVIELHISEPIKQRPEILDDVNPIPKPRRHSALSLNDSRTNAVSIEERDSLESARGKSF